MKDMAYINRRLFMLQLCTKMVCSLVESGHMNDDDNAKQSVMTLVKLLEKGVDLPDYSFDFTVTDLYDNEKYIA